MKKKARTDNLPAHSFPRACLASFRTWGWAPKQDWAALCRNAKASPAVLDLQPQGLWLCCLLSNMGNCPGKPVSSSSTQEAQPPLATACRSHQEPPRRWQPLRGAWCGAVRAEGCGLLLLGGGSAMGRPPRGCWGGGGLHGGAEGDVRWGWDGPGAGAPRRRRHAKQHSWHLCCRASQCDALAFVTSQNHRMSTLEETSRPSSAKQRQLCISFLNTRFLQKNKTKQNKTKTKQKTQNFIPHTGFPKWACRGCQRQQLLKHCSHMAPYHGLHPSPRSKLGQTKPLWRYCMAGLTKGRTKEKI